MEFRFFRFWRLEFFFQIWKNKGGVKVPLSQPKLRFGAPKGVITARKKSHSTIRNVFSTFSGFLNSLTFGFFKFWILGFWDFQIFQFWEIWFFRFWRLEIFWKKYGKIKGGVKIRLSEAELSFGTPKGVITARKTSHSTKINVFSTFFGFSAFWIFRF